MLWYYPMNRTHETVTSIAESQERDKLERDDYYEIIVKTDMYDQQFANTLSFCCKAAQQSSHEM